MNNHFLIFVFTVLALGISSKTNAQSNYKEASNSFALYSQTGDVKNLENAKKFIDESYKTKRDSTNPRNIIMRSMVYSSLAYADSTRKIKTDRDPIFIARDALNKLKPRDLDNYIAEVSYIKQNLAASLIYKANKALEAKDYAASYGYFESVNKLAIKGEDVTYNLALLAVKSGKLADAVKYYTEIINRGNSTADQHLELADVYKKQGEEQKALTTLETANTKFPSNKEILFQLIEEYAANESYNAIVPIIDQAIKFEPENINLNYLAGYANESENNLVQAQTYYQKVVQLDPNNYESNLALGLLALDRFLKDGLNQEAQYNAQNYLLKANEIRPYDINALKSLALYYKTADDDAQLDRVNLLLNQLSNN